MAVALALWSLELKAGEKNAQEFTSPAEIRITNIALGADLADKKGRTTVKLVYIAVGDSDDEEDDAEEEEEKFPTPTETVLCTLVPGQIEQVNLNIVLPAERPVVFASTGKNTIHLTGNYIDQMLPDEPPSEDDLISDEDMYSVDEEEEGAEGAEEEKKIKELPEPQSKKRALEEEAAAKKTSKKEKNKKQKAENGAAVLANAQPEKTEKPKKSKEGEKEKEEENAAGQEQILTGGVKIKDHKVGKGPKAKKGDTVAMRYVGKLTNGKQFDANTKGKPFQFELGAGDVIKGWDVGIVGMQAGGERVLTIPPSMGYGKRAQADIPASSTLIFDVKILSIKS